jgi:outer membrane lipoprotein-sorting protein
MHPMKSCKYKGWILILFCILPYGLSYPQVPDPTRILNEMIATINNIKTIQFTIIQTERLNGTLTNEADAVKMHMNPLKILISAANPGKSYEVLWLSGENNGEAWVHPGSFPFVTISLDPEGNIMKRGGHHSIFATSPNYLANLIRNAIKKDGKNFEKIAHYQGLYDVDGRLCYKILLDYPTFRFNPYIVKAGEDLVAIAEKNHLSEYMILERNKEISSYSDVKPGQTIMIPERYAKSIVLFIDKESNLPIIEMMYDDLGLFERYEFKKIILNPEFSKNEFSKDNPEYHF